MYRSLESRREKGNTGSRYGHQSTRGAKRIAGLSIITTCGTGKTVFAIAISTITCSGALAIFTQTRLEANYFTVEYFNNYHIEIDTEC